MSDGAENKPFWERKSLHAMTRQEWESLCDGCGKCCLHKLEDPDTGKVTYTNVACRLLDLRTIRCRRYKDRKRWVPDCTVLRPDEISNYSWLPDTCAYRRAHEGRPLPDWHHLLTGSRAEMHRRGASVKGRVISEKEAGDLADHTDRDLP